MTRFASLLRHLRWRVRISPVLLGGLLLLGSSVLAGCDLDISGMDDGCYIGPDCESKIPELPQSVQERIEAWEGDWGGEAEVTFYGEAGETDSTRLRDASLGVEFRPGSTVVDSIVFDRENRPNLSPEVSSDPFSADTLHLDMEGGASAAEAAFRRDSEAVEGTVIEGTVKRWDTGGEERQLDEVWRIEASRPASD
jgi:hypothetical protein